MKKKIEIEFIEGPSTETVFSGWKVTVEDRYADGLSYDEMLGLVASITMPENRPCLQWLKIEEQHKLWRESLERYAENVEQLIIEETHG